MRIGPCYETAFVVRFLSAAQREAGVRRAGRSPMDGTEETARRKKGNVTGAPATYERRGKRVAKCSCGCKPLIVHPLKRDVREQLFLSGNFGRTQRASFADPGESFGGAAKVRSWLALDRTMRVAESMGALRHQLESGLCMR